MNFDNNEKKSQLLLDGNFICSVDIGSLFIPSFGISYSGNFINDIMVDYSEKGKYKRQSQNRWVNSKLVEQVLNDQISANDFNKLLQEIQIVYAPNSFTHNLLVDISGNTYIIEPGFGNRYKDFLNRTPTVLTNFQIDNLAEGRDNSLKSGLDRYQIITDEIKKESAVTIDRAFNLLDKVKQNKEDWRTELSMVYIPNQRVIYFSVKGNLDRRFRYDLENRKLCKDKGFTDREEIHLENKITSIEELEKFW